jgi:hypothetical protein
MSLFDGFKHAMQNVTLGGAKLIGATPKDANGNPVDPNQMRQPTPEEIAAYQAQQKAEAAAKYGPQDIRNYQYGRTEDGANQAAGQALTTGANAQSVGNNILSHDTQLAADARARTAPVGDYSQQNQALGQSLGYGSTLAGLENEQGPSAAQAQLGMGTNLAMASQLALARSGRGFGGGAGAMGQAQSNVAGIQANQANQAAMLRAQEDAAWRQRQAANFGTAAGIDQGAGAQYGAQSQANLNAYLQNQAQGDQASLGYLGQGATAYGNGVSGNFAGQGLANQVRGAELNAGMAADDRYLRAWAADKGFDLQQKAADAQQQAAIISGVATVGGGLLASAGGPVTAAAGAKAGNELAKNWTT